MSLLLATTLLIQTAPAKDLTPSEFLSKIIFRYAEAKTLDGEILLTSQAGTAKVDVRSRLTVERPSKVALRQVRTGQMADRATVTSDGTRFTYDAPMELKGTTGERLLEFVNKETLKQPMNVGEIIQVGQRRLLDYSAPLWLVCSSRADLEFLRGTWATVEKRDSKDGLISLGGQYREYQLALPSGTWQLWATPDGDLRGYSIRTTIAEGNQRVDIENTWRIDLKINPELPAGTFKIEF